MLILFSTVTFCFQEIAKTICFYLTPIFFALANYYLARFYTGIAKIGGLRVIILTGMVVELYFVSV